MSEKAKKPEAGKSTIPKIEPEPSALVKTTLDSGGNLAEKAKSDSPNGFVYQPGVHFLYFGPSVGFFHNGEYIQCTKCSFRELPIPSNFIPEMVDCCATGENVHTSLFNSATGAEPEKSLGDAVLAAVEKIQKGG